MTPKPQWTGEPVDLFDRLERYWYPGPPRGEGDRPALAGEDEVHEFEVRNGVRLPDDLRQYFLRLNGVQEDPDLYRFWPLKEVRPVDLKSFTVPERDRYFFFADYMIECYYFAIYLGENPQLQNWVVIPCMPRQPFVATSFAGFVEFYLKDDPAIYGHV